LRTAGEGRTELSRETGRTWQISGDSCRDGYLNPITGTPRGWKLVPGANGPPLILKKQSPLYPKCSFTDYDVWVTPYEENQLFAGGLYLNNSGLPEWVGQNPNANIRNVDIVLWHVFGIAHIPRIEDWPVMPAV